MPVTLIIFFGVTVFLWTFNKFSRPKNYPPGPFLFPIVGALPQLGIAGFHESLTKWGNQYGNIFSFSVGPLSTVVINDYESIKEACLMEEFSGRPFHPQLHAISGNTQRGLIANEGPQWEAQRRFALRHLRDFGFGKRSLEAATQEDIVDLIAKFKKEAGQPISTGLRFNQSVISALWQIIAGQRYDLDDPEFVHVIEKLQAAVFTTRGIGPALHSVQWLIKMAPNLIGWTKFKDAADAAKIVFMEQQIHQHKETYQEGNFRDFIDVYINEMNQTIDSNSTFFKTVGDENLRASALNLLAAGSETTSSTLTWALFYLSRHPEIQEKMQREIDAVVGRSRLPILADQNSMPYATAIIMEVFRKSSLAAVAPRSTISEVKFHGFTIPKNTTIVTNAYEVHNNKKVWGDPEVFKPERFLTSDGKSVVKGHPPLIPFGIGRRQCVGETLARNNVFLFLVSIFQTFDIKYASNFYGVF